LEVWKSLQKWNARGPAVRSIASLDVWLEESLRFA
jgi:hypothetical protein